MGFDIGNLAAKHAKHRFIFEGEDIEIGYRPHLITPELRAQWMRETQESAVEGAEVSVPADYDCKMLSKVLTEWNLTENSEALPLTYENLLRLPDSLTVRLRQELFDAVGKLALLKKSAKT
jgi:hypothetical protein